MKAKVSSKGQVTIPGPIRRKGNIKKGSPLDFRLIYHDISEIKGMIKSKRKKPVSLAEMKKAIQEGVFTASFDKR